MNKCLRRLLDDAGQTDTDEGLFADATRLAPPRCCEARAVLLLFATIAISFFGQSCVRLGYSALSDLDGDGILNIDDQDIDGDGVSNDADPDMDGDGIANDVDENNIKKIDAFVLEKSENSDLLTSIECVINEENIQCLLDAAVDAPVLQASFHAEAAAVQDESGVSLSDHFEININQSQTIVVTDDYGQRRSYSITVVIVEPNLVSPCEPNPCQNAGLCSVLGAAFVCQCPTGFSGGHCEVVVNCPAAVINDAYFGLSLVSGTPTTVSCGSGFTGGPVTATCQSDGTWSSGTGSCTPQVLQTIDATSCAEIAACDSAAADGEYVIATPNGKMPVYCHDLRGTPREYITLVHKVSGVDNYGSYEAGGNVPGVTVVTDYAKLRINPNTLLVQTADQNFTTSRGQVDHGGPVTTMPYAVARNCKSQASSSGTAHVNLQGTNFYVNDSWVLGGAYVAGGVVKSAADQIVSITGGGYCGWNAPQGWYEPMRTNGPPLQLGYNAPAGLTAFQCPFATP